MNHNSKTELKWGIQNLELCNGWELIQPPAQVLMKAGTSNKDWRETCNGILI